MTKEKSLQKFTKTEEKINKLLALKQITKEAIKALTKQEIGNLMSVLTKQFNALNGEERDRFYEKIEPIICNTTKNQLWESNHQKITWAISGLMQDYGRMPNASEIAEKTKLSRQTVHKHLKEYSKHPLYVEQMEQFKFMASKVMAKIFDFAVNGDTAAAKLYFNLIGFVNKEPQGSTMIQNQNNYIQINGTVLSQESIQHLSSEQLNIIESIIKNVVKDV